MRTLDEITTAVRSGDWHEVSNIDLLYAVAAYDVLFAQLGVHKDGARVRKYLDAMAVPPKLYVSPHNDPFSADACEGFTRATFRGNAQTATSTRSHTPSPTRPI